MSKIKQITVVCQQGTKSYIIGKKYNGLLLDHIDDRSQEFPDAICLIYRGETKEGEVVFEQLNTPYGCRVYGGRG